jgi:hypothetical protein
MDYINNPGKCLLYDIKLKLYKNIKQYFFFLNLLRFQEGEELEHLNLPFRHASG